MHRTRWILGTAAAAVLLSFAALATAQYPGSTPPPEAYKKGFDSIRPADGHTWLSYLAGPECDGRGSGQPGYQKAAEFMAARFKEFGLQPLGDNGTYFQNIPFSRSRVDDEACSLALGSTVLKGGKDIGFTGLSADAESKGAVVFVRADSAAAKLADPAVLEGKIVILSADNIGNELRRQLFQGSPAAVLTVSDSVSASGWSVRRGSGRAGRGGSSVRGSITQSAARRLAEGAGIDPAFLDAASGDTAAVRTAGEASLEAKVQSEEIMVPNVVGMLEGSDPNLRAQHVGMGAHLDHLGNQNGVIYYGADDDGSGSTALLQVIKAFSINPVKPRRSIVFMAFCGEEMGLIGSRFYSENPKLPLENMVCELQMDMVGRNSDGAQNGDRNRMDKAEENVDTIRLVGSKRISMQLHNLILEANQHVNFRFKYDAEDVYTRSDHYSFASKGIPIAFTFSGFHPDYHRPTDTIEKINFDKIANTARLFYLTAFEAANLDQPVAKDGGG
ncbi:MAG: M28 family peptidase [Fimbriimonadaceae bacterium]|nr:M28 family peptidase [Chthonomonadaceae bacterium]MCO5295562.1 M28 family peptidase [Fimbriimonadaceae bacterium]